MAKNITASTLLENPGLTLVATYVILFGVNAVVLYFANVYFPMQVVLGTMSMTATWAIVHSMAKLALIGTFALPFVHEFERMKGRTLSATEMMAVFYVVNFIGLWLIARFSDQYGMGLSAWYVAAALAVVMDFFQGIAMMGLEKVRTGK